MKLKEKILDILFPRHCPVCHDIVAAKGELICKSCLKKLEPIGQPRCMKCGKQMMQKEREYCGDCQKSGHRFEEGMAVYPYNQVMKNSIGKYKFSGRREYGDFYIHAMYHYGSGMLKRRKPQLIVPVPVTAAAYKKRGYNQAAYLARGLSELTEIPMAECVGRKSGGRAQKELSARERKRNLRRLLYIKKKCLLPERVLVVDDVYTTGSTIDAMAAVLKENGAREVYFLALSQGKGF